MQLKGRFSTWHALAFGVLILIASCSIPTFVDRNGAAPVTVNVSFGFAVSGAHNQASQSARTSQSSQSSPQSRLLLSTVPNVTLTATNIATGGVFAEQTQTISGTTPASLSFSVTLQTGASYEIEVSAADAAGVEQFVGKRTLDLTNGAPSTAQVVYLIAKNFTEYTLGTTVSGTIDPNSFVTYHVPFSGVTGAVDFNTFGYSGTLDKFYQREDGAKLSMASGLSTMAVSATDAGGGVYVTLSNPFNTSVNYTAFAPHESARAVWAKGAAGTAQTQFNGVAHDSTGNSYVAGSIYGTQTVDFGNGVTLAVSSPYRTAVLVKYDANGLAQWAQAPTFTVDGTTPSSNSHSEFLGVGISPTNGNIVVVGDVNHNSTYNFGNAVLVTGLCTPAGGATGVAVCYNPSGTAQWAVSPSSITPAPDGNYFSGVDFDSSGNAFIAGSIWSAGLTVYFGATAVTTAGTTGNSPMLVKITSAGTVAAFISDDGSSYGHTEFYKVAVDRATDEVFVLGRSAATDTSNTSFGEVFGAVSFTPSRMYTSVATIPFMMKFNDSLVAQWGWGANVQNYGTFNDIVVGSDSNIYVGATLASDGSNYAIGNNASNVNPSNGGNNSGVVLRFDPSNGDLMSWTNLVNGGNSPNGINSIAADPVGHIYIGGWLYGGAYYSIGSSEFYANPQPATAGATYSFIAELQTGLVLNWIQTTTAGDAASDFQDLSVGDGSIFAAGETIVAGTTTMWPDVSWTSNVATNNGLVYRFVR